jgi:hypothetical protein
MTLKSYPNGEDAPRHLRLPDPGFLPSDPDGKSGLNPIEGIRTMGCLIPGIDICGVAKFPVSTSRIADIGRMKKGSRYSGIAIP